MKYLLAFVLLVSVGASGATLEKSPFELDGGREIATVCQYVGSNAIETYILRLRSEHFVTGGYEEVDLKDYVSISNGVSSVELLNASLNGSVLTLLVSIDSFDKIFDMYPLPDIKVSPRLVKRNSLQEHIRGLVFA